MEIVANIRGYEVEGLEELKRQIQRLAKPKKKIVTRAARAGMQDPMAQAKRDAPEKKGTLKKSIKRFMEKKPRRPTKTVYYLVFDRKFNEVFRGKKIKRPGLYGANPPKEYGYYPFSMEHGYKVKSGFKEGKHFIKNAIEQNSRATFQKMIDVLSEEIDKAIAGG